MKRESDDYFGEQPQWGDSPAPKNRRVLKEEAKQAMKIEPSIAKTESKSKQVRQEPEERGRKRQRGPSPASPQKPTPTKRQSNV